MAYGPPPAHDPTNVMGRRIGAYVIDAIPAIIVGFVVVGHSMTRVDNAPSTYCDIYRAAHSSSSLCFQNGGTAYYSSGFRGTAFLFSLVYWFAIAGVLQGATGATFGKHIVGLRVVDRDGNLCGMGKALLRTFIGLFEIGFCFLIALITSLVTHPHRRVGDFAAGTYVVARESVGTPIGAPTGPQAYPPQWTPPPATWGPPPAATPAPTNAPPTWGSPAANPPASETPATWGTPAATVPVETGPVEIVPTQSPPSEAAAPAAADGPGWASPAPVAEPAPQPQPQTQPEPLPQRREPQWDAQRNAWVYWEAETNRWLQHDPATGQWGPLR